MKILKNALVLGAATFAVTANAQFGAASKSDLSLDNGKQGIYGTYNPFARISAGGNSTNGYLFSVEKRLDEGKFGPNVVGGFFSRFDGANLYQIHYRSYIFAEDAGLQLGILGGDGFGNKNDVSLLYFKELPKSESGINLMGMAGLYRDSADNKFNLSFAAKASYALQNGFSVDATLWWVTRGGDSGTILSLGVGYRF
jgi:hypothetical protein